MPFEPRHALRRLFRLLLVVAACVTGYAIARADRGDPVVISQEPMGRIPTPRAGRTAAAGGAVNNGAPCLQPSPDPALTCQNGDWLPPAEEAKGGGGPWRTSGCVTPPPAEGFRCQDGVWQMSGAAPATGENRSTSTAASPAAPASTPPEAVPGSSPPGAVPGTSPPGAEPRPASQCQSPAPATAPGSSAACVGGMWIIR